MKHPKIALALLASLSVTATAGAQQPPVNAAEALRQAQANLFQLRTGHDEYAARSVAMLETATAAEPGNAALWTALGSAHAFQAGVESKPGGNPAKIFPAFQRSKAAFERALALNPEDAEALVGHGGLLVILSQFTPPGEPARGVAELNRAVALAPDSATSRLRVFSTLSFPETLRNREAEAEDLKFLLEIASSQESAYLRLLLGDLYAESGKPALARQQYEAAAKPSSASMAEARLRLAALDKGSVPPADITRMRQSLVNCTMCHGGS